MAGLPYARVTDQCTHGAVVITGSPTSQFDYLAAARLGDLVACPIPGHGINPIVSVLPMTQIDYRGSAHVLAIAHCGAIIITGSPECNESPA